MPRTSPKNAPRAKSVHDPVAMPTTTASGLSLHPRVRRGIQKYPYAMDTDMIVLGKNKGLVDCELTLPEDLIAQLNHYADSFNCEPGDIVTLALISVARQTAKGRRAMFQRTNASRIANGLAPLGETLLGMLD